MRGRVLPVAVYVACAAELVACGGANHPPAASPVTAKPAEVDPQGAHRDAITLLTKPFIDAELASAIVVGVYDGSRAEIYGFGNGPGGKPPTGATLFEIGTITRVLTSLLYVDASQRRDIEVDGEIAQLLPPGVTVPTRDKQSITLKELALQTSGLPSQPPSFQPDRPDPYAKYPEDALYEDLIHTELVATPGTQVVFSNYGTGLLGFLLGRKLDGGKGYEAVLRSRVLAPLGLTSTFIHVPPADVARRAQGTTDDLQPVPAWTWDSLAGAGGAVSDARDLLKLAVAEIDASQGGQAPLAHAMKATQEAQLEREGANEGIGWLLDSQGRVYQDGTTGGFHCMLGFDPKTRRAVVVLVATQLTPMDHLVDLVFQLLDGKAPHPPEFAKASTYAPFVGSYDLAGTKVDVVTEGNRLYVVGPGVPKQRMVPLSDHEFWLEEVSGFAAFDKGPDGQLRLVFGINGHNVAAARMADGAQPAPPPAPGH